MKIFFCLFLLLSFHSISLKANTISGLKLNLAISINPLLQITEAITKDKTNNFLLYSKKFNEHNYQLKTSDVKVIQQADLILLVDQNFENNLNKYLKTQKISGEVIEFSKIKNVRLLNSRFNQNKIDNHLWLNPINAEIFAENLVSILCQKDQVNCKFYQLNLKKFIEQNQLMISELKNKLANSNNSKFIFFRDCYQYFELFFNLKPEMIVDHEHSFDIKINKINQLNQVIANQKIKCLFGDADDEMNSSKKFAKVNNINFSTLNIFSIDNQKIANYPENKKSQDVDRNYENNNPSLNLNNKNNNQQELTNGYSQLIYNLGETIINCLE